MLTKPNQQKAEWLRTFPQHKCSRLDLRGSRYTYTEPKFGCEVNDQV